MSKYDVDKDTLTLSEFLERVEQITEHGVDLNIKAHGGACELTLYLPEDQSVSFSVINRLNRTMAWGLDKQDTLDKLQWAITKYHKQNAEIYRKLYESVKGSTDD